MTGRAGDAPAPLAQRLLFTLGALVIYRLGTYIPLPGIDLYVLQDMFGRNGGGFLGKVDMFSGDALGHMSIFALHIMPYLTVSFWALLLGALWPRFGALNRRGGRTFDRYIRAAAVVVAALQAYGIAVGLESAGGGRSPVIDPGLFFRFTTVITLTGGTVFLMWLGEQITARGIGNGYALLLFTGIVARMPAALGSLLELGRISALSTQFILLFLLLAAAIVVFIVFMESAQRSIRVHYRPRLLADRMFEGEGAYLRLKLNQAGIIPLFIVPQLLLLPATFASYRVEAQADWMDWLFAHLSRGQPGYLLAYAVLIGGFCFLYTALIFRPRNMAETLRNYAGFIPGYEEERQAADHLTGVLTRLTLVGALYLALVCTLPEILVAQYGLPFYFGGTTLLVVVCIAMDLQAQFSVELAEAAKGR
ncbi:MAG TPA: preprotein translocase subunit SecY [Stellaceae bacterium]|nr:preprotein translocase subunit SecY [Stellaceae bacterium]